MTLMNKDSAAFEIGAENYVTSGIRFRLHIEGEVIQDAETYIGYAHKGLEKIFESKKYTEIIPYITRIDNIVPFGLEYPFVLAYEKLCKAEVSKRALYIRVIHSEIARIINHTFNIGLIANAVGMSNILTWSLDLRRQLIEIYKRTLGLRIHTGVIVPGGVNADLNDEFVEGIKSCIYNSVNQFVEELDKLLSNNYSFKIRTRDVGIVDEEQAVYFAFSGPCLRASGGVWDLRRKEPYGCYSDFDFDIPICNIGDCYSRYLVRAEEIKQSVSIILQALIKLPQGDIFNNDNSFAINPNKEVTSFIEGPKGELGIFIRSDSSDKPYRCNIRTPSFAHAQVLNTILKGALISDVPLIVASLDVSATNIDK